MSDTQQDIPMEGVEKESGFRSLYDDDKPSAERKPQAEPPKEKRPTPVVARQPIAELAGLVWTGIGTVLEQTQIDAPVGRVMQFQAPIAGNQIDELIKGTWFDEILQPFVQKIGAVEGIGSLLALPLLVGVVERNPGSAFAVEPLLVASLQGQLAALAPTLKEQKKKQREAVKAMADANDALGLDKDADPIQAMLAHIFNGMVDEEPMPEDEETAAQETTQ